MRQIDHNRYEFKGTQFRLRAFEDSLDLENPAFVLEEAVNNTTSLGARRVELAQDIADTLGRTPDQIDWYEMAPDGTVKKYEFEYTHTDWLVHNGDILDRGEVEAAMDAGAGLTQLDRYNTHETTLSPEEKDWLKGHLGDALVPFEVEQNRDFARLEGPPPLVELEDVASYPSQREFENNPDVTYGWTEPKVETTVEPVRQTASVPPSEPQQEFEHQPDLAFGWDL